MLLRDVHGDVRGRLRQGVSTVGVVLRMHRRLSFLLIAIFALIAESSGVVLGQGRDIFSVSDVSADARAADEFAAKSNGIAQAQTNALRMLLERLTLKEDHDRLPNLDLAAVTGMVRDFSVDREKFGGGHYLASLTVRFKADGVRKILRDANIPFAETASRPVLVLPIFQTAGSTELWDDTNPWFSAWSRLGRIDGLLPLLLPVRDLSDVSTISAEEAVLGERTKLTAIADRYGAGEILVVIASLAVEQSDGMLRADVAISRYGGTDNDQTVFRRFDAKTGMSRDDLLADAARTLANEAVEAWKRENILEESVEQRISASVPIRGLNDWLAVRRRLAAIAPLKEFVVLQLSVDRAEVELAYVGTADQLRLAMAQSDLDLTYQPDTATWTLQAHRVR